jgi:DNA-binding CsgD family transcriptional regulator
VREASIASHARPPLTRRETEILRLIAEANSTKKIANRLGVSVKTIESHRTHLFAKLQCRCVAELVRYAIYHGIVEVDLARENVLYCRPRSKLAKPTQHDSPSSRRPRRVRRAIVRI